MARIPNKPRAEPAKVKEVLVRRRVVTTGSATLPMSPAAVNRPRLCPILSRGETFATQADPTE